MLAALLTCFLAEPPVVTVGPGDDLRAALAALRSRPGATLRLRSGAYVLERALELDAAHAGLTLEAAPGEHPRLMGGIRVTGWREEGSLWVADVSPDATPDGARLLVVDGDTRPRSRWPETGVLNHESVFDVQWMSTTGGGWKRPPTPQELTTLRYREGDLGDWLDPASAEVTVYHMWDESCVGVRSVDPATRTVTFASPAGHPPGAFGVTKYVVWNTRKGITQPGHWAFDRATNQVLYRPKPGETMDAIQAWLGTVDTVVRVAGAPDVTLRNLDFAVTNVELKAGGFGAGDYAGAVMATDAPDLVLEGLQVRNVAGTGIRTWNCPRLLVRRCSVENTGAGGIRAEGEDAVVEDCTVRGVGMQYPSAPGIWVGQARTRVRHNQIEDTSYSAVIGGGEGTVIERNAIARAMKVLHDGAGIYVGFSGGIVLRGNLIQDIPDSGGYGVSAYYIDEQGHDSVVEGNVSIAVGRPSQNHMARDNTIRDNLFVTEGPMRLDFARCSGYTLSNNVLLAGGALDFRVPKDGWRAFEGNRWSVGEAAVTRVTLDQYNEVGQAVLTPEGTNRASTLRLVTRGRVYEVLEGPSLLRSWDMSSVGPRPRGLRDGAQASSLLPGPRASSPPQIASRPGAPTPRGLLSG